MCKIFLPCFGWELYNQHVSDLRSFQPMLGEQTWDVSHCVLAIYTKKKHYKAKEESWKLKYFTMQKI